MTEAAKNLIEGKGTDSSKAKNTNAPVFIGEIIKAELQRQERSVTWLSRKINCDRRNIYDIFNRPSIDTGLLFKIAAVLRIDFFSVYSEALKKLEKGNVLPPPPSRAQRHLTYT